MDDQLCPSQVMVAFVASEKRYPVSHWYRTTEPDVARVVFLVAMCTSGLGSQIPTATRQL